MTQDDEIEIRALNELIDRFTVALKHKARQQVRNYVAWDRDEPTTHEILLAHHHNHINRGNADAQVDMGLVAAMRWNHKQAEPVRLSDFKA